MLTMTQFSCASTGETLDLTTQLATSGEGEVWRTQHPHLLAKIYHHPSPERIRKLTVMVNHPPKDPNAHINHISFAWPKSLILNAQGQPVGFLMPTIQGSVDLLEVYSPLRRNRSVPGFNWLYLHVTAMNLASIVWAIHEAGYVLGDMKPQNILVNTCALPAIIDTDSFQVRDPETQALYPCLVGSESFTPVELMGKDLDRTPQTPQQDYFRLGVLIHLLLFCDHPYKGQWIGKGESPTPNELLRRGYWPYAANSLIQPGPLTIPLNIVHPSVQRCFQRCFNQGHAAPELRPTAQAWRRALQEAILDLQTCRKVKHHVYSKSYGRCYWCDRTTQLQVDIFALSAPKIPLSQKLQTILNTHLPRLATQLPGSKAGHMPSLLQFRPKSWPRRSTPVTQRRPGAPQPPLPQSPRQSWQPPVTRPLTQIQSLRSASTWKSAVAQAPERLSGLINWSSQHPWMQLGALIAVVAGSGALLLDLSGTHLDPANLGLTLVGGGLCLGLVGLCYLLARVSQSSRI
ncbi:hypothetical protein GS597_13585 [Synechococcales cyanobacterium C]|uniref:Protein kinase domain-containing protein n=1 Tax=Petrachloros mirabilis ULC683 TaxID=2781853 RepID=A0A8K2A822_9CYAN|nr:hypothetical protein [Petrachloros mirabilis]NCJ07521.1 hypothetical protein [Petrachloros mirabilis ULC683]